MYETSEPKMVSIYKDSKKRAEQHIEVLKEGKDIVDSDRILQYLQETIDCLKLTLDHLKDGTDTKKQYAMYKDELGELGEEIIRQIKATRG